MILQVILPIVLALFLLLAIRVYTTIEYPSPLVIGCMILKLCAVDYDETLSDIERLADDSLTRDGHLMRQTRRKYFRLNWLHLCQEAADTVLFLRALRFQLLRIDLRKSGMEYEDREIVMMQLIDETVDLRWKQVRCQLILLLRAKLGLTLNPEMFVALLEEYKQLEEQFVDFVGMENGTYQQMLIDRLGLGDWGITRGGAS